MADTDHRTTGASVHVRRHLRFGWTALLAFLTLGLVLEALHGLKVGAYLDVDNETRRLMWTLGHAHGTLLALVNLGFAWTVSQSAGWPAHSRKQASWWLIGASLSMPVGFLLGGLLTYGGDPGIGVALVAAGGIMLFIAVLLTCRAAWAGDDKPNVPAPGGKRKRRG